MMDALQEIAKMEFTVHQDSENYWIVNIPRGQWKTGLGFYICIKKEFGFLARTIGQLPAIAKNLAIQELGGCWSNTEKEIITAIRGPERETKEDRYRKALEEIIEIMNSQAPSYSIAREALEGGSTS